MSISPCAIGQPHLFFAEVSILGPFLIGFFVFYYWTLRTLYILDPSPLSGMSFGNLFCPGVAGLALPGGEEGARTSSHTGLERYGG